MISQTTSEALTLQLKYVSCGVCRNRQVTAFYQVVDFFKPGYVLMENVVDIFKKEDGTYAKSAMASLLAMRYQVRAGIIAASDHGVPQIRNRSVSPAVHYCNTHIHLQCSHTVKRR